jgi:hypothetical protein
VDQWRRLEECAEPSDALLAIDNGADWYFHWCAGAKTKPADATSQSALDYARTHCIGPPERERLAKKAERKGRTKTVVLAERWEHPSEGALIVFFEDGPYTWPERLDPRRQP